MSDSEQRAKMRLLRANLRPTAHRILILAALQNANRPIAHTEIQRALAPRTLDRVTIYRTLSTLTNAELVHQVQGSDGVWRFCSHDENARACPAGHPHFLCQACGNMLCLLDQPIPHYQVPEGFSVTHKQMLIIGVCKNCQK